MEGRLPEEKLSKLLPALPLLAERISAGDTIDRHTLQDILSNVGVDRQDWALQELQRWSNILVRTHVASTDAEKDTIAAELQDRGIPEFPAILAVSSAGPKPLSVELQYIDFGCLISGEGADATLKVSGSSVKAMVRTNRLKLTLLNRGSGVTLMKVVLSGGSAGESLRDSIILQGDRGELKVPVSARWEEPPRLRVCKRCNEKPLFWNFVYKKYECLNLKCKAEGPSPDKLVRPHERLT